LKILVTGGTGYIGSHTAVELMQKGFEVSIIDNLSNSYAHVLDAIEKIAGHKPHYVNIDLCDKESLEDFFNKHTFDAVIHFAAFKAVGESVENPLKYYSNNLISLINLLGEMTKHQIKDFVFSSSCSVYGNPKTLPVQESTPFGEAESPYAKSKQICEQIISDVIKSSAMQAITLRYFNPIGSHESILLGEWPIDKPNNLIPVLTQAAAGKRAALQVFGSDYQTKDGSCIRDYIHVSDIAEAHVSAIERLLSKSNKEPLEIFNLGSGIGYSVLEVIHAFENATGERANFVYADRRPGDVEKIFADNTKAAQILKWSSKRTLEESLLSAWKWELYLTSINEKNI